MEEKFIKTVPNANWSDCTFIFSCVSAGNVSQLATDLLISTLPGTNKAGYLLSALVHPLVGYDAYVQKSNDLSLSCELYENKTLKLVILQQRAPLFKGKRGQFVQLLVDFIRQERFRETICLTSSHAYERLDSQLSGVQCRYLQTNSLDHTNKELQDKLGWIALEKRSDRNNTIEPVNDQKVFIPGGGIAQKFFRRAEEYQLNAFVLIVFAHEGNNIPEANQLVNYLNHWKDYLNKSSVSSWRTPISWQYLFGQTIDPCTQSQIF